MLQFLEVKARGLFWIVLAWEDFKDWLSANVHISHWTIHFALGIALLFIFGRLLRKPLTSAAPLIPIAILEFLNELLDFLRDYVPGWVWNYRSTVIEVALTIVPPAAVVLFLRAWTRLRRDS